MIVSIIDFRYAPEHPGWVIEPPADLCALREDDGS